MGTNMPSYNNFQVKGHHLPKKASYLNGWHVLSFWSISKGLRSPGSCCFSKGRYPDLPEWVDRKKLQHFVNQFKTRFRRFCNGKFTPYHHCVNLRDLHFGRLSGFVGFFKPISNHKVTFLCVHSSAQISSSGGSPSGRGKIGVSCRSIDVPFSVLRSFPAFAD